MGMKVGILRGDGICPEIVAAAQRFAAEAAGKSGIAIDWVHYPIGWEAIHKHDVAVSESAKKGLQRLPVSLLCHERSI